MLPLLAPTAQATGCIVAGAGPTVLLLHSSLASKSQWTALVERLSPRYRAIALDLHGYGDNSLPSSGPSFTLDDEVRLVTNRLDELAASSDRIHLVGHSYGALVAMRFAQLNPDRITSLSLYEPVAFRVLADDDPPYRRSCAWRPRSPSWSRADAIRTRHRRSWTSGMATAISARCHFRRGTHLLVASPRFRSISRRRCGGRCDRPISLSVLPCCCSSEPTARMSLAALVRASPKDEADVACTHAMLDTWGR